MNPQLPTPTPSFEISDVVMADGSAAASLVSLHAGGLVASVLSYGAALVNIWWRSRLESDALSAILRRGLS